MSEEELTREMINARYVEAVEHLKRFARLKNQREFSKIMKEQPAVLSQIKSGFRNASITQLTKIINDFDLNANYFLRQENSNEKVFYSDTTVNPNISGDNQDVMVGKNVSKNDGVVHGSYYNVEKLIQHAPEELKEHIRKLEAKHEELEKENAKCQDEIGELKKIINSLNTQLAEANASMKEKDERLYQAQCELIEVYKSRSNTNEKLTVGTESSN